MTYFLVRPDFAGRPSYSLHSVAPALAKRTPVIAGFELSVLGQRLAFRELIACYLADGFRGALTARCVVAP